MYLTKILLKLTHDCCNAAKLLPEVVLELHVDRQTRNEVQDEHLQLVNTKCHSFIFNINIIELCNQRYGNNIT